MAVKIGSSEWWTSVADRVLDSSLAVIQTKLQGVEQTGNYNANYVGSQTGVTNYLPYVLGAVLLGGIVLVLAKR